MTARVPPPAGRRALVAWLTTSVILLAGALVAAALDTPWAVVGVLTVAGVVEWLLPGKAPFLTWALDESSVGMPTRRAVGLLAVTVLAGRHGSTATVATVGAVAVACVTLAGAEVAGVRAANWLRSPPLLTRNVDMPTAALPPSPARPFAAATGSSRLGPALLALTVAAAGRGWALPVFGAAAGLACALPVMIVARQAWTLHRRGLRRHALDMGVAAWAELDPEVILYFAGAPDEIYQVAMWLGPVERLGRRSAVLLRDRAVLAALPPTTLPVFCVVHNGTLARLELHTPTAALFVTHSGNNLALLRRSEVRPVFVGHGDSDKPDSMNRFARVYDEVWVAGPLGRERYQQAAVGVRDDAIREIGRPQLPSTWPAPAPPTTVLYAPTWEGWGDDPHHTSVALVGPKLIEALLAAGVHVRYRPHPLTGVRGGDVDRAHRQMLAMLGDGGAVGPTESLHESFASAHLLIADVSSVMSDWLATDRPYATVDTRGLGQQALRRRYPAAAGATVLDIGLTGLADWVAEAPRKDPAATARRRTRARVLGAATDPDAAFGRAVTDLLGPRQ
ncbi:MAG TPA: CDP-glycerol glycerophosphotransferase family protein [Mycobacteriales bacterium]|nr:CDP-glycerol glycerophosphotransferase family protein [Mycobacteriales bacterium]